MQLLSGRWPALLLYYLKDGVKRFSDLQRDNPTVSHRILAAYRIGERPPGGPGP